MRDLFINTGEGNKSIFDLLPFVKRIEKFTPDAPVIERQVSEEVGVDGEIQTSPILRYKSRNIKIIIFADARRPEKFPLMLHSIYKLFSRKTPYYITDSYTPNKRWKVTGDALETIEKDGIADWKHVEINLKSITGLAESVHSTDYDYNLAGENWNFGMNIPAVDSIKYRFTTNKFEVYNGSDVRIMPPVHDYFVDMKLAGSNIKITNKTTEESMIITRTLTNTQTVKIMRQYTLLNGTGIDVTGRFPSLEVGWNVFEISNASSIDVKFNTKFYYLY
ncbi:hypothetical protein [Bacillus phage PM1]|uniref:Siphovirus-type tail component RIFT-related domain-containing protein n=1 Tax=Bacillus phage PM1 TaxID=547228 RepID=M4ZS20_9CAUD|nr:hypothetical protein K203_gp73 [Bacillus phage PM1]BAM99153.1 hypothetical protein [Bacillus phage PM1]